MNKAMILGRLSKAPDVRTTQTGVSVTSFTVAVARKADREKTDYLDIVTWRGLADICGKYLVKGQQVCVTGEIQTRTYTGQDGKNRTVTEIVADDVEFLAKPQQTAASTSPYAQQRQHPANDPNMFNHQQTMFQDPVAEELNEVMDEDLPF